MESFNIFFKKINQDIKNKDNLSLDEIKNILSKINEYFFTGKNGLGKTEALKMSFPYFSEFHKFWEQYHDKILNPTINEKKCEEVADVLHDLYVKFGKNLYYDLYSIDTRNLNDEEICKVRYFSANQDFRGSRSFEEFADIYNTDPTIFDVEKIHNYPVDFLRGLNLTGLSQSDKREKFAKTSAKILLELGIEPFGLFSHFDKDLLKIRNFLIDSQGAGYGQKKTDMFIRDMVVLGVWKNPQKFNEIDVASDINTIKVALRTGILETDVLLLSSFLDVFCHQYGLIDEMTAKAWRNVWEIWNKKYPKECIDSPCLMDILIYRIIGREFCKERLCLFQCENKKHSFMWHSGRNKTCQECFKLGDKKAKAFVVEKVLPCSHKEGYLCIEKNKYVVGEDAVLPGLKECPFADVCNSKDVSFIPLSPPKSISILGRTGWDSARALEGRGGGGLMA